MPISFHSEDVSFLPKDRRSLRQWIEHCIASQGCKVGDIAYVFCSDEFLLGMNREHLNHDYYTDIITFDMSDVEDVVSADIFISIDRVKQNAEELNESFEHELHRVMVHGILHLTGFDDKTEKAKKEMRITENQYITLITA